MLFGYEPDSSGGKFIQNKSIDSNHYNRFYSHFEKEKERQSFHNKKNVRFSKEVATPNDYQQAPNFYASDKKPILKSGQNIKSIN